MGIPGLWNIVSPVVERRSLLNLATIEGFQRNNRDMRTLKIGVDISILLNSCYAGARKASLHSQAGENHQIQIFFSQLCQFLQIPATIVFVFDGLGRPPVKRGTNVVNRPLWLTNYAKRLIDAFGFYSHDAPGEAEAELAKLNSLDLIDIILTNDSDTLVFGGKHIIRIHDTRVKDISELFTSQHIEAELSLSRGGLLLFALLVGGDYDSGVVGCGPTVAHGLAKCGFGDKLMDALLRLSGTNLRKFLDTWRGEIREELCTNAAGILGRRYRAVAAQLPDSFPNISVAQTYLDPLTSWSVKFTGPIPDTSVWRPCQPQIGKITVFCAERFGWDKDTILEKLRRKLWSGAAFQVLCSPYVFYDPEAKVFSTPTTKAQLISVLERRIPDEYTPQLVSRRIRISVSNFIALAGGSQDGEINEPHSSMLLIVPEPILAIAMRNPSLSSNETSLELLASTEDFLVPEDAASLLSPGNESDSEDADSAVMTLGGDEDEDEVEVEMDNTGTHCFAGDAAAATSLSSRSSAEIDTSNFTLNKDGERRCKSRFAGNHEVSEPRTVLDWSHLMDSYSEDGFAGDREVTEPHNLLDLSQLTDSEGEGDLIRAHRALAASGEAIDLTGEA